MKIKSDAWLYLLEIVLLFGICLFMMLEQGSTVSLLFHITFFVLLFGLFTQLYRNPWMHLLHVLAVVIIVISFLHVAGQAGAWNFNYFRKLIMFSCTVLMFPFVSALEVNEKMVRWILILNLGIAALYTVMYLLLPDRGYLQKWLTFHFSNPNATAMFLMHSILYCAISLYYFKGKFARLLIAALAASLIYYVYETEARSCYVALAFFAVLVLVYVWRKVRYRSWRPLILIVTVLPLVIVGTYFFLIQNDFLESVFSFLDFGAGKNLLSRVEIWQDALDHIQRHPILGDYYGLGGADGVSQVHNTHLDVWASYGIVPLVLFLILLYKGTVQIAGRVKSSFSKIALFAFFAVIVQGSFEAALVSGGTGLYIMSFGFLVLAKCERTDNSKKV